MRASFNGGVGIFVQLKNEEWLANERYAGKIAAGAITLLRSEVNNGTEKSMLELDALAEAFIRDNGCEPTFKGYKGHGNIAFPNAVCISVNRVLVHGICTDYHLQDGDKVSFDLGTTYSGNGGIEAIADTATTCIYGAPKSDAQSTLVAATREALDLAIGAIKVGKHLGIIGSAIYSCGQSKGFAVVERYGGHSIGNDYAGKGLPHMAPFVSNRAKPSDGIVIQPGLVLAIEPLFVLGKSNNTIVGANGWDVIADEICSHHEDTVYVHSDHVEIITREVSDV